jgi:hypothetical protein
MLYSKVIFKLEMGEWQCIIMLALRSLASFGMW